MDAKWPKELEYFTLFPRTEREFFYKELFESGLNTNCSCPLGNESELIQHIFIHGMCPKHVPRNLLATTGKLLIPNFDKGVLAFLDSLANKDIFDLLGQIE